MQELLNSRLSDLKCYAKSILAAERVEFNGLVPSQLDEESGVYFIAEKSNNKILYVGKTTNLRTRLYTNHLQGNSSTARLKKYLVEDENMVEINSYQDAKEWIKDNCYFKFLKIDDRHQRGQLEGGFSYLFNTKYIE